MEVMMSEHFVLSNQLHIPAIGMGTGWMNTAYKNPKFLVKKVGKEIVERITGRYSKENNYNASYDLRKIVKFSSSVKTSAKLGYEMFDTAFSYNNCKQMGKALRLDKNRNRYFIISKCSNYHQRNNTVLEEFESTLRDLETDYIDLYLIHWPQTGCYKNTWKILENLYEQGKVKSIGVSNFSINQLKDLMSECKIKPMVNEIECHPMLQQKELREFCKQHGIQLIAHTPTGKMRNFIKDSCLSDISKKYNKSITQVILRWHYQLGDVSIPNSLNPEHAKENLAIFDFELNDKDMENISLIDCNNRIWPDPENCDFTKL